MNPYERERFELDNGKVVDEAINKQMEGDILLLSHRLIFQPRYFDFLRNVPWARVDN
jgi:hypothetical protein